MSHSKSRPRARAVPSGQFNRLSRLGGLAGGVLGGMALDGLRRVATGERPRLDELVFSSANAARVAGRLAHMRGAAMKIGQLMSMEAGEFLPAEFAEILSRLRADADFMPSRQLKSVLASNWGADFLTRFERFDTRPIAAASIGQVHRARTKDGRDLAVKVQYPGVRESIDSDVRNVGALIRWSGAVPEGLDIAPFLEEARRQLHDEADYEREGAQLDAFGALLADDPAFVVPARAADLSTRNILAMDYLEGAPIETLATQTQAERDRVMGLLIELLLRELFEFRRMQTDPNFANYRYQPDTGRIVLLDFGATRTFGDALIGAYRRFLQAGLAGDRVVLRQAAFEMGYLDETVPPRVADQIMEMIEIGMAPLRAPGLFDFARVDVAGTLRDRGLALAAEKTATPPPPIDTLFAQRKSAGLYLLGRRLQARVDVVGALSRHL